MLRSLRVKNLALVEDVSVEFAPGLNVITGETGAGKSVLIGALALLLGERADKGLLRAGADQGLVEAVFELRDPAPVDELLEAAGLAPCDDGQLVLRRTLTATGAGRNVVNDAPATLQVLKRIGERLVDMHGPYDHQSLLSAEYQLNILDAFGHLWQLRAAYERLYEEYRALEAKRRALEGTDNEEVARLCELLRFQVQEIEQAKPQEREDEAVAREHAEAAHAQRILELAETLRNCLTDGESSAFQALAAAQQALGELAALVSAAGGWREEARALAVQVQELSRTIEDHVRRIETDPGRLRWLEERMATYHRLKRKYGNSVKEVLEFLERARARLHDLETRGEQIAEVDARLRAVRTQLEQAGGRLSKARQSVAQKLVPVITRELRDLGFTHGAFDVELAAVEPGPTGMDAIEFRFAPNLGEPARALRAIASSGEISRVMLALKAVLASHDRIPVLVFDEIDANVGGSMGKAIGGKLQTVSRHHQVLCITHLPQVAVYGGTHFAVGKEVRDGRTRTWIARLDAEGRVEELARMLGGRDLTSVTLKHAREMLRSVQT